MAVPLVTGGVEVTEEGRPTMVVKVLDLVVLRPVVPSETVVVRTAEVEVEVEVGLLVGVAVAAPG